MLTIIFEIAPQAKIFLKNVYFLEIFNKILPLFTISEEKYFGTRENFDIFDKKDNDFGLFFVEIY